MNTGVDLVEKASALESESDSESADEFGEEILAEYAEPLGGSEQQELSFLPGRLRACLPHWRGFTRRKVVLSVWESGYRIEWKRGPPPPLLVP